MKELEIKILNIDPDSIRKKMKSMNAKLVKKENQINKLFDFPDGRLLNEKGYARIRISDDLLNGAPTCHMTVKKLISQDKFKIMEEYETKIENGQEGENIFKALGLVEQSTIKRYRESYLYKNSLIEIDINDKELFPIPYLEVEANDENELENIVNQLGYEMKDTTTKTIFELIEEFKARSEK